MIVRRALLSPLLLLAAVIGQLAVVNRVPLPGAGKPDLVLLVVAAIAVSVGPLPGLLAGFAGGLAIDVAPPGGHLAGEYALVYCLAGYACGRIRDLVQGGSSERSALASLTVMAAGVAAGEAGKAALGLMVSDPAMTGPAIRHVLPAAVVYDVLLCPFVAWLVLVAVGRPVAEGAPGPAFPQAFRLAPAFRLASAGAAPRLRLAGSSPSLAPRPVRPEPRLRLASGRSLPLSGTNPAYSAGRPAAVGGRASRPVRLNFASAGGPAARRAARAGRPAGKSPPKGWLRPGKPPAKAARRPAAPGKGWARTGLPAARPAWTPGTPRKGWARTGRPAARPAPAVPNGWRRKSPPRGWLRPVKPAPPPRRKSPSRGWLRPVKPAPPPRRKSPSRGWLRPVKPAPPPRRKSPSRGWLRPVKPPKQNWYTRSPNGRWLRRGRRRRLLLGGRR